MSAPLRARLGGWVAVLPVLTIQCGEAPDGRALFRHQYSVIGLRFTGDGRFAEGEERDLSTSRRCGYGTATRRWYAQFAGIARE